MSANGAYEREIHTIRCLYNALLLPMHLTQDGTVLYSLPEEIPTAADITGDPALAPGREETLSVAGAEDPEHVRYFSSQAGEWFISLSLPGGLTLTAGPLLTEPATDAAVSRLIRSGLVRLSMRTALRAYYDTLPVLTARQYYYTGSLMEMAFAFSGRAPSSGREEETASGEAENYPEGEKKAEDLSPAFIPSEYYRQTQNYRSQLFLHSPYMTEQEICHYISKGDTESALRVLAEINQRPRAQLAESALRSLKNSVICSCAFMARAAISGGVLPDDAFTLSDAYIQQIENCTDIGTILRFEEKMVAGYTSAVNSRKEGKYSPAVSRAIAYIGDHLCEKLTLEMIAEAVFLNPNYLSGLFRSETGETVHNYIIRRRVEDAGFFVRNSAEPIADIASFYQFSSQSHFVQSFKKYMGVTPGVYRNR